MRLHLPVKLFRALLACMAAVSFVSFTTASSACYAATEEEEKENDLLMLLSEQEYPNGSITCDHKDSAFTMTGYESISAGGSMTIYTISKNVAGGLLFYHDDEENISSVEGNGTLKVGNLSLTSVFFHGAMVYNSAGIMSFSRNESISFENITAHASAYANAQGYGAVIYNSAQTEINDNGIVSFTDIHSSANSTSTVSDYVCGGAIYNVGTLTMQRNDLVSFSNVTIARKKAGASATVKCSEHKGGAIFNSGTLQISGDENACLNIDHCSSSGYGGAIWNSGKLLVSQLAEVTFKNNEALSGGHVLYSTGTVTFVDNGAIVFNNNGVVGGVSGTIDGSGVQFLNNDSITFSENKEVALRAGVSIRGNGKVLFENNYASNITYSDSYSGDSSSSYNDYHGGSALYASGTISDNKTVIFSGNHVAVPKDTTVQPYIGLYVTHRHYGVGGAVYVGTGMSLTIAGNSKVEFRGNYEGTKRLRGLYSAGSLTLSAPEGGSIVFYDSMFAASALLNQEYSDSDGVVHRAGGDIIFSGKTTEEDFLTYVGEEGTATQILDSRTSEIVTMTNLYGGRLIVEDKAILKGRGITAAADSGATVRVKDGTLNHSGYALTFNTGTSLEAEGVNAVTAKSVDMKAGSTLSFVLGEANLTTAALTLTGTLNTGAISVAIDGLDDLPYGKHYTYALVKASTYNTSAWTADKITIATDGVSFDDLVWDNGTLYLNYATPPVLSTATWSNGSGDGLWNTSSLNWTQDGYSYAFAGGVDVIFGNEGAGTVSLVGNLAPGSVLINNGSGFDYTFAGTGKLTGAPALTKQGAGKLTINTANDYTGGTTINGGTLVAGNAAALGSGTVTLKGGTLEIAANGFANDITFAGDSSLMVDEGYELVWGKRIVNESRNLTLGGTITFNGLTGASSGGAIYNTVSNVIFTLSGNGDITFSGNTASSSGGAIYNFGTFELSGNGDVTFSGNTASHSSSSYTFSSGGAIDNRGTFELSGNRDVTFRGNTASHSSSSSSAASTSSGGAIYNSGSNATFTLSGNGAVTFSNNTASSSSYTSSSGGAIYNFGTFELSGNGAVTFSGNTASHSSSSSAAFSSRSSHGGAIYNFGTFELSGNGDVTFSNNTASSDSGSFGGAIFNSGTCTFTLSGNGAVTFSNNTASSSDSDSSSYGGAIYNGYTFELSGNGDVTFSNNTASSSSYHYSYGGAIYNADTFELSGNGDVTFSGNTASSSSAAYSYGGAIYNADTRTFTLSGNGDVTFSGNTASSSAAASHGGAIFNSGTFELSGNGEVLFEKNVEVSNGTYRLRSIYSTRILNLSALEGKSILFRDSLYVRGTVNLNQDYTDSEGVVHKSTGDIIFTGATTEADLREVKGGVAGTSAEITNSRTSEIATMTNLYAGRLIVEDKAILKGQGITAAADSGATVRVKNGTLNHSGYALTFNNSTKLEAEGVNAVTAKSVDMLAGSTLSFVLGEANLTTAALTLTGTLTTETIFVAISGLDDLEAGRYTYALMKASTYNTSAWTADKITIATDGVSFDDLVWQNGTLYLNYSNLPVLSSATWSNGSGDGKWNATSLNWTQDGYSYAYANGVDVIFGNEGAGTVSLVGNLAPKSVLVDNGSGFDYTFAGDGKLTGTTTLTKQGAGKLTINTANDYTGGTTIKGGTLVAGNAAALGTGTVTLNSGTLEIAANGFANDITFAGDSSLMVDEGYELVLNKRIVNNSYNLTLGGSITFKDISSSSDGGAIYNKESFTLSDNGDVIFRGNTVPNSYSTGKGGAIYNASNFTLNGNKKVIFCENSVSISGVSTSHGGAIYNASGMFLMRDNGNVIFSGNSADVGGGAIRNYGSASIMLINNGNVTFSQNSSKVDGGAIYCSGNITISGNESVTFNENLASCGGAINSYASNSSFTLSGNGNVSFSRNSVTGRLGGAIFNGCPFTLSDNGDVTFSMNTASSAAGTSTSYETAGGAIYNYATFSLSGNGNVLFEKNTEIGSSGYRLRSIYSRDKALNLSSSEGKSILFRDTIYVNGPISLNQEGTGDIIFTGATTEADLREMKGGVDGTATEITNSRTSEIATMTNLYGGRLIVEDKAILKGRGITTAADSGATVRVKDGTLNHSGYALTFNNSTKLEAEGASSITASTVAMKAGSTLSFVVGEENLTTAALTLTGTLTTETISVAIGGLEDLETGRYTYALMKASSYDTSAWTADKITVATAGVSFDDLVWDNGTLYLNYANLPALTTATWDNGSGDALWNASSINWTQGDYSYAYADGVDVIFGNEGAGTVSLVGNLAPKSVLVDNGSGFDYTFAGDGKLTGTTALTKQGEGKLTINTANDYTGGTTINGGTLVAGNAAALGTGIVTLNSGTLEIAANGFANDIAFAGDSSLLVDEGFTLVLSKRIANEAYKLALNGEIEFTNISSSTYGGAIYNGYETAFSLSGNGAVTFCGNSSTKAIGGAIFNDFGTFLLRGNENVTFRGNAAAHGGAIFNEWGSFSLVENGNVTFSENCANHSASPIGGAIVNNANAFTLSGNGDVLFEKNVEISDASYRLRSIWSEGTLNLSASTGRRILFKDSVYASGTVNLNQDYTDSEGVVHKSAGDIIFTGATTEADLREVKGGIDGTEVEILNSRTSEIATMTDLNGGRLIVEDKAILKGRGITAAADSGATVRVKDGTLNHSGYALTFNNSTKLEAEGASSITASTVALKAGSTLSFVVGEENLATAALTLTGTLTTETISIAISGIDVSEQGRYTYALMKASSYDTSAWTADKITVATSGVSFDDLVWDNGTLYLNYAYLPALTTATWDNGSGDGLWNAASLNWTQDGYSYAYADGVDVIFGNEGAGAVSLVGNLAPKSVLVDNGSGFDYTFAGEGKLTGDSSLIKQGEGKLTINTANDYTGGTAINGGTVLAGNAAALGTGIVAVNGGTLEIATDGYGNETTFAGTSSLVVDAGYQLALSKMLANSGVLTVSGTLNASSLTLNTIAATHIDVNGNSGTSGFAKGAIYSVQVVNGGTTSGADAAITHLNLPTGETLVLGENGVATAGGAIDYSEYLLTGSATASTSAIHAMGASATVTQNGGTLTVDDAVTVTTTGGTITLNGGTLNGTISGATINATAGSLVAALSGSNTLNGTNYALQSVIANSGVLTVSGTINAAALTLDTTAATHIDVNGNSDASGFAKDAIYAVTIAEGTTVNSGATITHGAHTLTLGENGVATAGGAIDYSKYLLTGNSAAATSAIHAKGASATVTQNGGTLTVDDAVTVATTAGSITLNGGTLNGTISGATINAASGALNATLSGNNMLTGNHYELQSVLQNTGNLVLNGSFDLSRLTMTTSGESYVDVSGKEGQSGFTKAGSYSVSVVEGGGQLTLSHVTLERGGLNWTMRNDGTAVSGGGVDHAVYFLTGDSVVSTTAIHGVEGASAAKVSQNGGTLTVDDAVTVMSTGGAIVLNSGALSGTISGATINASSGALDAALNGVNTLNGTNYMLNGVLDNRGTLTLHGTFNASKLTLDTTDATHINVAGESGANGFAKSAVYAVTIANGTIVNGGTTITHGERTLALGNDGVAQTGGAVDYSSYLLADEAVSVRDIRGVEGAANATITQTGGTLTVDGNATVNATAGTLALTSGTLSGSISGATINATSGTLAATLKGENTLTGNHYALNKVLVNEGTLTVGGSISTDALTLKKSNATHINVSGASGANGFAKTDYYEVQLVNGGSVVNSNAVITHSKLPTDLTLALGTNGIANAGGVVDYSNYLLVNGSATVSAIHGVKGAANAAVTQTGGSLTVNGNVSVTTTGGAISLTNGTVSGSIRSASINATGGRVNADISGASSVTVNGKVTLAGANTYTGMTTVNGGSLTSTALSGDISLKGGTLAVESQVLANGQKLAFNGGDFAGSLATGKGSITLSADAGIDGALTLNGGSITFNGHCLAVSGTLTLERATTLNVGSLTEGLYTLMNVDTVIGSTELLSIAGTNLRHFLSLDGGALVLHVLNEGVQDIEFPSDGEGASWGEGSFGYQDGDDVTFDGTGEITLEGELAPGNITVTGDGDSSFIGSGSITGNAGLEKDGEGTLTMNDGNSYTGTTSINGGTVIAGGDTSFGTGDIALNNGTLDLNGHGVNNDVTVENGTLNGAGNYGGELTVNGSLTLGGETTAKDIVLNGGSITGGSIVDTAITANGGSISSAITGSSSVTSTGEVTLSGNNSYTGGTTVNGGTLTAGSDTAFGTGDIALNNGTLDLNGHGVNNDVTVENGTLNGAGNYGGELTVNGSLTLGGETTAKDIVLNGGSIIGGSIVDTAITANGGSIGSAITGSSSVTSTGEVTLSGNNSYTGGTTVNGGTLTAGSDTAFGTGDIALNNGTLDLNGHGVNNDVTVENGTLNGAGNYGGELTVNGSLTLGGETTAKDIELYGGSIIGGSIVDTAITANGGTIGSAITGSSSVTSTGEVTLSGNNSYTGGTNVNGGTLTAGSETAFGAGDIALNGGTLNLDGHGVSNDLTVENGTLNGAANYGGELTVNGSLTLGGETTAKDIVLNGGSITGGSIADTSIVANGGSISSAITGSSSVTSTGEVTLSGNNSYTGGTTVNGGTLTAGSDTAFGTGNIALNNGTLDLNGHGVGNDVTVENGTLNGAGNYGGELTVNGSLTLGGETTAKDITLNGGSITGGSIADTAITANGGTIGSAITGSSSVTSTGEVTLSGNNSYTGGTTVNGGTLTAGSDTAFGTGDIALNNGTLDLNGHGVNNDVTVENGTLNGAGNYGGELTVNGSLTLGGETTAKDITLNGGSITGGSIVDTAITANGGSISSAITGSSSVTSTGEVTLSGNNSYTDGTTVNGGTLTAGSDTAFGTGDISLNNGALDLNGHGVANDMSLKGGVMVTGGEFTLSEGQTLEFNGGSVQGNVTTSAGAKIALESNGTIAGSLTLNGGTLALNGHSLTVTETLTLSGETTLDVSSYGVGTYELLTFGRLEGRLDKLVPGGSDYRYFLTQQEGALTLQVKALNNSLTWSATKGEWKTNAAFGDEVFRSGDDVAFRTAATVTISGEVNPDAVLVDSAAKITFKNNKKVIGSGIAGDAALLKTGTGLLTLNAGNTYSGGTELRAGTLKGTATDSFGSGTIIVKGGTLDLGSKAVANGIVLVGSATLKGDSKFTGAVSVNGKATLLAKTSYKGMTTIGADSLLTLAPKASMAGSITIDGGELDITAPKGMTLAKDAWMLFSSGTVKGLLTIGAKSELVWQDGIFETSAPVLKGGTVDLGGWNALTLTGSKAQVQFGDKVIDLPGKGTVRTDEALTVNSGTVTVNSMGGYEGELAVNGGTLKLSTGKMTTENDIIVKGTAAVVNGGTHYGDITVDGLLAKGTNIKLLDEYQKVALNGDGTMLGTISGKGIIDVNASIDATAAKLTAATINLNGGTFTNTKGIKLAKGQTLTLAGASLDLGPKGALATVAGSTLVVDRNTTLTGSLTLGGGELVFNNTTLELDGTATLTLSKAMTVTGSGTIHYTTLKAPKKLDLVKLFGEGVELDENQCTLTFNNGDALRMAAAPLDAAPALLAMTPATNPVADAMVQADWGILDAERAFMGAVNSRSQHATLLDKGRGAAWVSAFGASVRHGNQGTHHGSDGNIEGAAFGLEHAVSDTGTLGLAVGRSKNRIAATGVTHLRQETAHVALYGQKQLKHGFTADAAATYGDTETKLGTASWTQKSAALSARLAHAKRLSDTTAYRTFGGLTYEATDAGSIGTVHTGSVQNLRAELGAGVTHTTGKAHLYAEAALMGDLVRHNPTVDFGGGRTHGANPGRLGVRATIGGIYAFTDTWSGTASYGIEAESRSTAHTLNIGVSKSF